MRSELNMFIQRAK